MKRSPRRILVVSVIVPHAAEAGIIEVTLREALAYFRAKPYDFEIIVVADGNDGNLESSSASSLCVSLESESSAMPSAAAKAVGFARYHPGSW